MEERLEYLSSAWSEECDCAEVHVIWGKFSSYVTGDVYVVGLGDSLGPLEPPTHDGLIFQGWYYSDADTKYDPDAPVTGDISICAKWEHAKDSPVSVSMTAGAVTGAINRDTLRVALFILFLLILLCLLAVDIRRHWKRHRYRKQERTAA